MPRCETEIWNHEGKAAKARLGRAKADGSSGALEITMVYLLGCDHYMQEYDLCEPTAGIQKIERELKEAFYLQIEQAVGGCNIEFIGEECSPAQRTIARAIAEERGCK